MAKKLISTKTKILLLYFFSFFFGITCIFLVPSCSIHVEHVMATQIVVRSSSLGIVVSRSSSIQPMRGDKMKTRIAVCVERNTTNTNSLDIELANQICACPLQTSSNKNDIVAICSFSLSSVYNKGAYRCNLQNFQLHLGHGHIRIKKFK